MRVQDYLRVIFKINHGFNLPRYLRDMVSLRTSVKDLRGTYRHEILLYIQQHMGFIPLDNLLPKDGRINGMINESVRDLDNLFIFTMFCVNLVE